MRTALFRAAFKDSTQVLAQLGQGKGSMGPSYPKPTFPMEQKGTEGIRTLNVNVAQFFPLQWVLHSLFVKQEPQATFSQLDF